MNDLRYFRNDKLDLVNREKQRFGFRKLSSGKIASVLLGVTIFGSFALNGQVVKAYTTTDSSQTSAVVEDPKNKQTDEKEQSGPDASAQKDSDNLGGEESHEARTGTVTPGTTSGSKAETGKTQADSTGTDTPNANRGGTTSDTNGAWAAAKVRKIRAVEMQSRSISNQPTAAQLVDHYKDRVSKDKDGKGTALDLEHAQSLLDYYNNLETVTKILGFSASSYGEQWLESTISKSTSNLSNEVVSTFVSRFSSQMVTDTQPKIDAQIEKLEGLAKDHPNNSEIKNAINNLRDAKNSVTVDNITSAKAMENVIDTLDHYGSPSAYDDLKRKVENNKTDLKTEIDTAKALADDPKYYNSTNKDAFDKALSDAETVYGNDSASQQDVDDAKSKLEDAKSKLDGEATKKNDLQSAYDTDTAGKATDPKYYNASKAIKQKYDEALKAAKDVLDNGSATQTQVDDAKKDLEAAKKALDGTETKKTELQSAYDTDTAGNATDPKYYNASEEIKQKYDEALKAAKDVLDNGSATQKQVEDAKSKLEDAKSKLDGKTTDKDVLQSAVEEANTTKLDDKYYNASQDKKQAYDELLAQATKLLNDKTASQKAVDDAVANLEKAKAELNGEPNFIGGDYTPSEPSNPSTETPAEKTTEKILMYASYLYDNKGIKIDKPTVKSYVTVVVAENPVTINGIKYYKVAGKDEYIKAGNIDGTLRVITHNSYIYNNKGKATRNKGIKRLVKKTRIVRTYGAPINIKGHMMYRIGKNRYIKARNFEGTLRRLSHNSFVYDENGKATRNKGIRRLLKKSRVVRTFDAPVKINGHMMYRVDNGYVKVKNFK